ncbi:MAG TPA: TraR/DksA family transcriptional regulator [Gammaproteobacteria bacterium]|nr:TraR/DksA family transcriptional regulator [Gammaproteobacteria bacterium]
MAEPLSNEQLVQYRKRLRARHGELLGEVRRELLQSDSERYIQLAGAVHDTGDESVADLLADLSNDEIDRHVQEIRRVEAALQRIAVGAYGVCADCGQAIAGERLEVYPTATRCYTCQTKYEQTYDQTGGSTL